MKNIYEMQLAAKSAVKIYIYDVLDISETWYTELYQLRSANISLKFAEAKVIWQNLPLLPAQNHSA